jgi:predicted ATP-dependent serine protease
MRGRGAEFETVLGLLDGTQQGRGRVLLVEGEPGTGKSLLLARAGEEAGRRGFRVVAVSAGAPGRGAHPPTAAPARGAAPALGE